MKTIPANLVINSVQEKNQVFVEWEARGTFKNRVEVTVPGSTVVRFQEDHVIYYRDYVNFALFVQWAPSNIRSYFKIWPRRRLKISSPEAS